MKPQLFVESKKYFNWWISTLNSCVPAPAVKIFKKYNKDVELVIRHQGDTIFLQDGNGRIIDTISTNYFIQNVEPENTGLDISLYAVENSDISVQTEIIQHEIKNEASQSLDSKLEEIDLTDSDDVTIVCKKEDKTIRLMELVSEDDTLVLQDDQGTVLDINSNTKNEGDSTIIYYSDKGKIRQLENNKEKSTGQNIDINLAEEDLAQDKMEQTTDEFNIAAGLLEKHSGNKKCLYLLPDEKVFSIVLNYPVEVLENIENVLRYDLEKHIPLNFNEVRFFYGLNILSAKKKVDVEVMVIKSTVYDQLVAAFESQKKRELICTTQHFYKQFGTKINILGNRKGDHQESKINLSSLHTVINVMLLIGIFVIPYQVYINELNEVKPKTNTEIKKAGSIVASINQLNQEMELRNKLNRQISNDYRIVELLAQLSEQISTDAWISRFTYKNGEIKLKGQAVSATSVSDDLNDTGLFESIKFISSIIKNPNTKKETFELSLKVKSDA